MRNTGFSLIEIMVVVVTFALMSVLVSQIIILSLRGTTKSGSSVRIRSELDHVVSTMTSNLRNASSMSQDELLSTCFKSSPDEQKRVYFYGSGMHMGSNYYECKDDYMDSRNEGRLTSDKTELTECFITCVEGKSEAPDSITIKLVAKDKEIQGDEAGIVSVNTKILLRNY